MGRGARPVGVAIDVFVDHQMLRQNLAIDALAGGAGEGDRLRGVGGGDVDDVKRGAEDAGDGDGA